MNRAHHSTIRLAAKIFSVICLIGLPPAARSQNIPSEFSDADASKLLSQLVEGLQGHSLKKAMSAFDLSRMDGGANFKEQIAALFNQYDVIRVRFKLTGIKDNEALVDGEIDETPADRTSPPQRRSMQLHFDGARTPDGWKFVDVQPRSFF